jgi:hypothetical protein
VSVETTAVRNRAAIPLAVRLAVALAGCAGGNQRERGTARSMMNGSGMMRAPRARAPASPPTARLASRPGGGSTTAGRNLFVASGCGG